MKASISQVMNWLRWPNLLIVFITLAFIRYGIIAPALRAEGIELELGTTSFLLLSLTTLLITFGGYVINDIFDQETDAQNKGDHRAIGIWISASEAWAIYLIIGFIGLIIATYLAWAENKWQWLWIYPVAVLLLGWYSKRLKSGVLFGNLLVSVFCAGVALLLPFSEMEAIAQMSEGNKMMQLLYFYAAFAGISNLLREIIKDAEDIEGDRQAGLQTLPIKYGLNASRYWALFIGILLCFGLIIFYLNVKSSSEWAKGFLFLTTPLLLAILIGLAQKQSFIKWKTLSMLSKLLMLGGLVGMFFLI